jgi:hypothetical protein
MDGWGWLGSALRDGVFSNVWFASMCCCANKIFSCQGRSGAPFIAHRCCLSVRLGLHVGCAECSRLKHVQSQRLLGVCIECAAHHEPLRAECDGLLATRHTAHVCLSHVNILYSDRQPTQVAVLRPWRQGVRCRPRRSTIRGLLALW